MANQVIWALRADNASFNARYSSAGITPAILGGAAVPTYDVDATAINGHNYNLDAGVSNTNRGMTYPARGIFSTQAFSFLMRIKIGATTTSMGLLEWAPGPSFTSDRMTFFFSGTNTRIILSSETNNSTAAQTLTSTAQSTAVWTDYVITWDGTGAAGKIILYIDGVSAGTATAPGAATNPRDAQKTDYISIGAVDNLLTNRFLIEECVIWNYVIDPTAVTLDSGTGSLNGAARTSLVTASSFNGASYSDPGVTNVKSGTTYTYAGSTLTGTEVSTSGYKYI
jgi:hypothetical protein